MKLKTLVATFCLSASVALSGTALSQDMDAALQALDNALPGKLIHNPLDLQWDSKGNDMRTKLVDAEALPSGQAISARLKKRKDKPWDAVLTVDIDGTVSKGDKIQAHYWIRTAKAAKGKDAANVTLFIGRNEEPYDYIISEDLEPSSEWKLVSTTGTADADYGEGKLKAEYQMGRAAQTIEIGGIYISRLD